MSPETVLSMLTHDLPNLQKLYYANGCAFDQHITKVLLETLPGSIRNIFIHVIQCDTEGLEVAAQAL